MTIYSFVGNEGLKNIFYLPPDCFLDARLQVLKENKQNLRGINTYVY